MSEIQTRRRTRLGEAFHLSAVVGLVVFHWVNNWAFVSSQVTILGWDRPAHLIRGLIYNDMLQRINLRSLFEVLTWSWNRPPLAHLITVPLYRLFGVSTDVALMRNCVFVAILLLSVYGIGRRMYSPRVGSLAAFMVSTYPILFSISRMPYVDYALTAMVALCVYLAVASDGFRRRGHSLLLGLVIGLGILTKWPFLAFSAGPLAYVAVRSGSLRDVRAGLACRLEISSRLRRLWASSLVHGVLGLCLALAWYWPNRDRLEGFLLGYWLIPVSWLLVSFTLYVLSRPSGQGANLMSAAMVGATVGSLWSLPNLRFSQRFVKVVYSGLNMEGVGLGPLDPAFYFRYLRFLPWEQLSPLYFVVLCLAAGVLIYSRLPRERAWESLRNMSDSMWILLLWFGVSMSIFTFSLTMNSRFDIALLPPLALVSARGLCEIRPALIRRLVVSIVIVLGLVQFFALSYDRLGWLRNAAVVRLPGVGEVGLQADGSYIELPSSGRADERYFVGPRILDAVQEEMLRDGKEAAQFGNLVNRRYSNSAVLRYLTYETYSEIEVREFARFGWEDPPIYEAIFECDYLLIGSEPHEGVWEEAREALKVIESSPSFFAEVFDLIWECSLPDGDSIYLYKKQYHMERAYNEDDYRSAALDIQSLAQEGDGIILTPPEQVEVLGRYCQGHLPPYPLPQKRPMDERATQEELEAITAQRSRLFLVLGEDAPLGGYRLIESYLNQHAYRAWDAWSGAIQVVLYGTQLGQQSSLAERSVRATLGEAAMLEGYWLRDDEVRAGDILRFTLHWRVLDKVGADYKVFAHLLDDRGAVVAQRDSEPVGGSRPTSSWDGGEELLDNYGILIPDTLGPGEYSLVVGMYHPGTGERLSAMGQQVETVDNGIMLDRVVVTDG